jgi:hypothetical protein
MTINVTLTSLNPEYTIAIGSNELGWFIQVGNNRQPVRKDEISSFVERYCLLDRDAKKVLRYLSL